MKVLYESTLSDSYIYGMFNVDQAMTKKIADAFTNGLAIDSSYIEEQILQIKRTRISPLSEQVLNAFETGKILLMYARGVKIPQALPFVITKIKGATKAVIFVNSYGTINENSLVAGGHSLNILMKDLYVLMEGAYIAQSYYEYPKKLERSLGLMKFTNALYTSMILRILNKEYALSMNQDLYNQVSFVISRFYMEKVWGSENHDVVFNYAVSNTNSATVNRNDMLLMDDTYTQKKIEKISDLINFIHDLNPRMEKLNMRYFTECYINTYRAPAILSMDTLPYFLFTVAAVYCGSFIVNQPALNDIIKNTKGANIFYSELSKIL